MNQRTLVYLLLLVLAGWVTCCLPYEEEELTDLHVKVQDELFQRIATFQYQQQTDSLLNYFEHKDPTYRYLAAIAFGSIRDTSVIDDLALLLMDRVDEVRAGAAYALGQMKAAAAEPALIDAFDQYDTLGVYKKANRAIMEAIGKCGSEETLQALSTITTYDYRDTFLLEGQTWGLYQYALRNMTTQEGTDLMVDRVTDPKYPNGVRFMAANYLYRASNITIDSNRVPVIARNIYKEEDPRIRMALAIGLGKAGTPTALDVLLNLYRLDQDYRVKCNVLSAFGNFSYADVQETVLQALRSPNIHIARRAAQYLLENGISEDATLYWRLTRDTLPWQVQIPLFAATLRHMPLFYEDYRVSANYQLRQRFLKAENPFEKVAALEALAEYPWNFRFVQREGYEAAEPMVRGASVATLGLMSQNRNGLPSFKSNSITRELIVYFREAILSGDPAMMVPAAEELAAETRNYRAYLDSLDFLEQALRQADPEEAYFVNRALRAALDSLGFQGELPAEIYPLKPIEWSTLMGANVEPIAIIRTTKGRIRLRLLPQIAPGTVANFIDLARSGYYTDKFFYRVVPNFVIQGAHSLDYDPDGFVIRSELPPVHYHEAGMLGMASQGRHTESSQFFITHSPTPHLDGNYTLFGRVLEGMDVVHDIQIGDKILEVIIQNN